MPEWIAPIIIAAMAGLIWVLTIYRKKRVQKYTDPYCVAFMEICDHILGERDYAPGILYEDDGKVARMLPIDKQPEIIQELLNTKPDEYALERFKLMYELRGKGQLLLSAHTMISSRYNGVLNRLFALAEVLLATMSNIDNLKTRNQLLDLNFVLLNQSKLRNETMPAIMSKEGKNRIIIQKTT